MGAVEEYSWPLYLKHGKRGGTGFFELFIIGMKGQACPEVGEKDDGGGGGSEDFEIFVLGLVVSWGTWM
jgi:hypothetical protein